jgi:hypothetical protein
MRKLILATVVALGMLAGFSGRAGAQWGVPMQWPMSMGMGYQAPMAMGWENPYQAPMDMSWAMQRQMALQQFGDQVAIGTADAYLEYMNWLRMNGYTGPSLPTGVTTQSLQGSIRALNDQYQVNNGSALRNMGTTSQAVENWDLQAIRGCTRDLFGRYYCP